MSTEPMKSATGIPTDFRDVKSASLPGSNVPGFLSKLWLLVEDEETNVLIQWGSNGTSFIVQDQTRFAKEILPRFFKHSNMASFIRQLNMYGFRKKVNLEHGSLKVDNDDIEFQHPNFVKGQPELLENIKRKVAAREESKIKVEDMHHILREMKGQQDNFSGTLQSIQRENQVLWREVMFLRQRHEKQQKIVNRLIQFLLTMVKPVGLKRKQQLMIESSSDVSKPKYPRIASPIDNMQLVQPTTFDTDIDTLPVIGNPPSSVVLADVTDNQTAEAQRTLPNPACEAGTADVSEPMPATLDPSLFELDIPPVSEEAPPAVSASPIITSPASVQPSSSFSPPAYIEDPYKSLWQLSDTENQPNTEMALLLSDDDNRDFSGSPGSSTATTSTPSPYGPGSRAVMKRMLSHEEQRDEVNDHVSTVQENLDMIQHMLTSSMHTGLPYNIDMGSLLEIFNSDNSGNTNDRDLFPILADSAVTDKSPNGEEGITGTEVVQYGQTPTSQFTIEDEDSLLRSLDDDAAALAKPYSPLDLGSSKLRH